MKLKAILITALTALPLVSATLSTAGNLAITPSVTVGAVAELPNAMDIYYKAGLDIAKPSVIGPLGLEGGGAVSICSIPYMFTGTGSYNNKETRVRVDEFKADYQAAVIYPLVTKEVTYNFYGGVKGSYMNNEKLTMNVAGPMAGIRSFTENDWGIALVQLQITPALINSMTYTGQVSDYEAGQHKSKYGKPAFTTDYKITFGIPSKKGFAMEYSLDGQMIAFDKSYRYYNGLMVGIRF